MKLILVLEVMRCCSTRSNVWSRYSRLFVGVGLYALALNLTAQQADTATPEESSNSSQLLFVEMPVPFEPELDTEPPPDAPAAINAEDDPEFIARMNTINDYQSRVEEIEFEGGVWDQSLVEELSALGLLQQQQGNHEAAIEIFDRAIHVSRIHSGLHSLDQIPAVERMIESHLSVGNWSEADNYNDYLFYIQQRAYGPHDPRMIPVLDKLASWNIQAFNIGYGDALGFRLNVAQILLNAAASMVAMHFGEDDERIVSYRRNIANSAFLVSRNPELMAETRQLDYRNAEDLLLNKLAANDDMRPRGYEAGEKALREIVQHYSRQDGATYELAAAMADLGDWYLIYQLRRAAEDMYAEAWKIIEQSEHAQEWSRQLFGKAVPIPTFANVVESLLVQTGTTSDGKTVQFEYVDVVFDVTATGAVRNIEILSEETAENSARLSRLQREIRNAYFRPRIENGEMQRSDRNYYRYRYWY